MVVDIEGKRAKVLIGGWIYFGDAPFITTLTFNNESFSKNIFFKKII